MPRLANRARRGSRLIENPVQASGPTAFPPQSFRRLRTFTAVPILGTTEVSVGDWHHFAVVLSTTGGSVASDADNSGTVDELDAQALATNWGLATGAGWADGDFTGDGAVNAFDASVLAANWGATDTPPSQDLLLYVDGVLECSVLGLTDLVPAASKTMAYGDQMQISQTAIGFWDEVRFHDASLSPSEFLNAPAPAEGAAPVPEPSAALLLAAATILLGILRGTRGR